MEDFARAGASIGSTSATLEKTHILAGYLGTLDDDDLRRAAVFMSGRAFSPSKRRTLGLGWAAVSKAVTSISGLDGDELGRIFRKHSDLGDWAGEALAGRTQAEPVTLQEIGSTRSNPHRSRRKEIRAPGKAPATAAARSRAIFHQDRLGRAAYRTERRPGRGRDCRSLRRPHHASQEGPPHHWRHRRNRCSLQAQAVRHDDHHPVSAFSLHACKPRGKSW